MLGTILILFWVVGDFLFTLFFYVKNRHETYKMKTYSQTCLIYQSISKYRSLCYYFLLLSGIVRRDILKLNKVKCQSKKKINKFQFLCLNISKSTNITKWHKKPQTYTETSIWRLLFLVVCSNLHRNLYISVLFFAL